MPLTLTVVDCPGESVPLAGLKVTPFMSLKAFQLPLPGEPAVSASVTAHE